MSWPSNPLNRDKGATNLKQMKNNRWEPFLGNLINFMTQIAGEATEVLVERNLKREAKQH